MIRIWSVFLLTVLGVVAVEPREQVRDSCISRALRLLRHFVFLDECRGMRCSVDLLQGADRHVRVNLRGLDVFVAEDLLDVADVGSVSSPALTSGCSTATGSNGFSS